MSTHPRLFLSPAELVRLKKQIRTGPGRKIVTALRQKQDADLADLALLARLDDDAAALQTTLGRLQTLARGGKPERWSVMYSVPLAYDLICEQINPADRQELVAWFLESVVRLQPGFYRCAGSNIPLVGMASALFAVLVLEGDPGVPDLTRERTELLRMFEAALYSAIGPSGYPAEDIGYGTFMLSVLGFLAEAVRRAGWYDAYRECPRFRQSGRAILHFVQPWGEHLSNTGDHGDDFRDRQLVLARLAAVNRDPSLRWLLQTLSYPTQPVAKKRACPEVVLGKGRQVPCSAGSLLILDELNKKPARPKGPTQFVDRGRDIVSFRSGWDKAATFVVFDGSLRSGAAQGHAHDCAGHFSLSALGEYFAIDTGRYNIEQDQHNVVLVDGKSGQSTGGDWRAARHHGRLVDYRPGEFCDFAAVDSSQQSNCYWAYRHLGLVNGADPYVWMVEDVNFADDEREFWWTLNTAPGNRITLTGERATIRGHRHGNLLEVHFVLPATHSLKLRQHIHRCGSPRYVSAAEIRRHRAELGEMVHGPVFERPRLVAKVRGGNGRFMSLLLPRRQGMKPAKVQQLATLDNALAVSITWRDVEDTLIFAYEHNLLEANGVSARGQWIVERRSLKSRRVITRSLRA
ncbi:MAG: hypothetical protein PCFJNLEI_02021 [Verrucomicrobiae bacterium]|nr:hypothetical protein [Verrucomicrobiae bacterium]